MSGQQWFLHLLEHCHNGHASQPVFVATVAKDGFSSITWSDACQQLCPWRTAATFFPSLIDVQFPPALVWSTQLPNIHSSLFSIRSAIFFFVLPTSYLRNATNMDGWKGELFVSDILKSAQSRILQENADVTLYANFHIVPTAVRSARIGHTGVTNLRELKIFLHNHMLPKEVLKTLISFRSQYHAKR